MPCAGLRGVEIPDSIRVIHYPDVEWARSYPTLGPQGVTEMDVNGTAGGLEMYFGLDVLRHLGGGLTPVQWRGRIDGIGGYQGELVDKPQLQKRFRDKLNACYKEPSEIRNHDWSGMKLIIDRIRTSFHEPKSPL